MSKVKIHLDSSLLRVLTLCPPSPMFDIRCYTPKLQMGGILIMANQEVFGYAMFFVAIKNIFDMFFDPQSQRSFCATDILEAATTFKGICRPLGIATNKILHLISISRARRCKVKYLFIWAFSPLTRKTSFTWKKSIASKK